MPTCARAVRLPEGETFNFRSFPLIPIVDGAWGSTLILAWVPASAGMTGAGAGMTGQGLSLRYDLAEPSQLGNHLLRRRRVYAGRREVERQH